MVESKASEGQRPRVVVGYDGSLDAIAALEWAADYASVTEAEVTLIAAWDWFIVLGAPVSLTGYDPRRELGESVERALHLVDFNPDRIQIVIDRGKPAQLLVDASRDADLLVVGRRGSGGFEHLVLGSVSSYCLSHAACTVCIGPLPSES